jgi:hypothetical protein
MLETSTDTLDGPAGLKLDEPGDRCRHVDVVSPM